MKRRDFLRALVGLPVAAAAAPLLALVPEAAPATVSVLTVHSIRNLKKRLNYHKMPDVWVFWDGRLWISGSPVQILEDRLCPLDRAYAILTSVERGPKLIV